MKKIFNKIKELISFKKLINNEELAYNFNEKFSLYYLTFCLKI